MNKVSDFLKRWFVGTDDEGSLQYGNYFIRNRFVFLAFLTPFVLMCFGFANSNFYPFGDGVNTGTNQVLVIDMWHQYFPFLNLFSEKIKHFESFFYSWDGALGFNFMGMMSYYASSPVYLLSAFFSKGDLTMAMGLFVVIKISFAGAFFCIYLRGVFKRYDLSTVVFSTLYALCAFAMGYYWCLMWLDVMALLPLAVLGMIKLMDEGKFRMFTLSVAMMIISNYYIAAMTCAFIVLYYLVLYFSKYSNRGMMHFLEKTVKVGFFALIGVGISAIMLLPTFFALKNTYYFGNQGPTGISFYNPIMDVLNNLLPNVKLTVREGLPNIYCGLISVILGVLFLMCKTVSKKEKILYSGILGFLILSFNLNQLDYMWHGFKFPNELPFRYSFVFSFVLITMAFTAFMKIKDITAKQIGIVAGIGILYLSLAEKLYKDVFDYKVIYVSIILLVIYSVILLVYKTGRYKSSFVFVLIFLVVFAEGANNTVSSVKAVGNSNRNTYYEKDKDITQVIKDIELKDKSFYRMETNELFTCNPPALYKYRGVSQFNSMINTRTAVMMKQLGYESDPGSNSFLYHVGTPITESMLSINYLIGRNGPITEDKNYSLITQSNGVYGYKFKYQLPIAYMVDKGIKGWNVTGDPFAVQNDFIRAATGTSTKMFTEITPDVAKNAGYNVNITNADAFGISCSAQDQSKSSSAVVSYVVPKEMNVYAYIGASGADTINVQTGSKTTSFPNNRTTLISIGNCKAGETVTVTVSFKTGASYITCSLRGFEENAFQTAYNTLKDQGLNVTDFSDGYIKGTVNVKKAGILYTTIPYEKGWGVKVDGKSVKVEPVGDAKPVNVSGKERKDTKYDKAFVAIPLEKSGAHTIEFSYVPEGFPLGVLVMVLSLALLIAVYYMQKKNIRILVPLPALVENEDDEYAEDEDEITENDSIESEQAVNNSEENKGTDEDLII